MGISTGEDCLLADDQVTKVTFKIGKERGQGWPKQMLQYTTINRRRRGRFLKSWRDGIEEILRIHNINEKTIKREKFGG